MHIDELRSRFGLSRNIIHEYVREGLLPPPVGYGRWARYGRAHMESLAACVALRDLKTSPFVVAAFLRDEGISVTEYVRRRESAIRTHGLGYL